MAMECALLLPAHGDFSGKICKKNCVDFCSKDDQKKNMDVQSNGLPESRRT